MPEIPKDSYPFLTQLYAEEGKKIVGIFETEPGLPPWEDQNYPRLEISWVYNVATNGVSHA